MPLHSLLVLMNVVSRASGTGDTRIFSLLPEQSGPPA